MKRILVPLDGSDFAAQATQPALRLAARHGAEVHLASIVSELPPPTALAVETVDLAVQFLDEEEARAEKYLGQVRSRVSSGTSAAIQTHVRVGPVARSLLALAEDVEADLLVLTTHGRGSFERLWLGSVADQLLRSSTLPLLLIRGNGDSQSLFAEPTDPKQVFVPLDGSKAAEEVFGLLREVLPKSGSRITIATVLHRSMVPFSVYLPDTVAEEAILEEHRSRLHAYLEGVQARLESEGLATVETRLVEGVDAARSLLEICTGSGAELIAMSTQGRGAVARFFVGSVADKMIRGSGLPILVVRRPEAE